MLFLIGFIMSLSMGKGGGVASWAAQPVGYSCKVWFSSDEVKAAMAKDWWLVPEEVAMLTRGAGTWNINWLAWTPAIVFWTSFHLVYFLLGSSLVLLFRQRWVEVEKLPFPLMLGMYEAVDRFNERRFTPAFLIGLAVGFFINLQILLTYLFPWWPDIIGWRAHNVSPNGCAAVASWSNPITWQIGSTLVGFMRWNMQPLNFLIAYLVPLDISFSMWSMTILFMVLVQIAYYMGYFTGVLSLGGCCRALGWTGYMSAPSWGPPLYWSWLCMTGGCVALIVMMMWRARDYLRETFRSAIGKVKESAEKEHFSYRTIYLYILISCIVLLAWLAAIGVSAWPAIVVLATSIMYILGESYVVGLTGAAYLQERAMWPKWTLKLLVWPKAPMPYTSEYLWSAEIFETGINVASGGVHTWGMATAHGFGLANRLKMSSKMAFYMMLLALFIGLPISMVIRVWWINIMGGRAPTCDSPWDCAWIGRESWDNYVPDRSLLAMFLVAGFIVVAMLDYLRIRFIWWPIHPIGFLLSGATNEVWTGAWSNFLGAWIAKWITLKIGGSKLYESQGIPFVAGALVGTLVVTVVGIVLSIIRFFIPF